MNGHGVSIRVFRAGGLGYEQALRYLNYMKTRGIGARIYQKNRDGAWYVETARALREGSIEGQEEEGQ